MEKGFGLILMTLILAVGFLSFSSAQATDGTSLTCEGIKSSDNSLVGKSIPDAAPFTDEVFNVYVADENFGSINLTNKTVTGFGCSESSEATYNAYIEDSSVLEDFQGADNYLDVYNEKRKSGEIEIEGTSFGRDLKMKIVNFVSNFF